MVVGLVVLAGAVVLLVKPDLLGGGQPVPSTVTAEAGRLSHPAAVTSAAAPTTANKAAEDPLASFLVRFGRANPFAPLGAVAQQGRRAESGRGFQA